MGLIVNITCMTGLYLFHNNFLFSTDIFLPTPDSLLVNLNECKEVGTSALFTLRCVLFLCSNKHEPLVWSPCIKIKLQSPSVRRKQWQASSFPQGSINRLKNKPVPTFLFQLVQDLLKSLPNLFQKTMETQSALGSALQAAFKLLSPTGGRMSVFQTQLPNLGVGALQSREDPNQRASAKVGALMTSCTQQQHYVICMYTMLL